MFARLFREGGVPRDDLRPSWGCCPCCCVREAVSGRGRPKRRLKAFAGLLSLLLCSRGCFGKRPAQDETEGPLVVVVVLVVVVLVVLLAVVLAVFLAVFLIVVLVLVIVAVLAVVLADGPCV